MLKKILVVFVMLAMAAFAFAADVALVTLAEGKVTASIQDEISGEAYEWLIEDAEILPAETEVMLQKESLLKFVHFHDNVEYEFKGEAQIQITEDGILSEQKFASSDLKMVSAKFELDKSMRQQVGAVISDAQVVISSDFSDTFESKYLFPGSASEEIVFDRSGQSRSSSRESTNKNVSVMLALPVEIARMLATDINTLTVTNHEAVINTDTADWVVIRLELAQTDELATITLKGDRDFLQTKVFAGNISQGSMVQAWSLEKQNLLPQAAAVWVEQASSGVELAEIHLSRIKALMLVE